MLGDGTFIDAVKDPWLKTKDEFHVDHGNSYVGGNVTVSEFIDPHSNNWQEEKVYNFFSAEYARMILTTMFPRCGVGDRVVWNRTTNGQYNVKTGYHLWFEQSRGPAVTTQANNWGKLWRLDIPHKVNIFLWRFCRNNVPVQKRLSTKGISLPILRPMCNTDIEHNIHVFFDCPFASSCRHYAGLQYDMSAVEFLYLPIFLRMGNGGRSQLNLTFFTVLHEFLIIELSFITGHQDTCYPISSHDIR